MPSGTWKLVYVLVHLSTPLQTEKVEYTGVNVPSQCATIRLRTKNEIPPTGEAQNTAMGRVSPLYALVTITHAQSNPGEIKTVARFGWYRKAIRAEDSRCSDI